MRGMGIDLRLGWIRLQLLDGELERAVQGLNDTDQAYEISNVSINTTGKTVYELDRLGYTFKNDVNSYRLAFNIKDKIMSSLGKYFSRFFRRAKVLRYRPYCTHNAMIDDRLVGDNLDDDGDCSVCKFR